MENDNCLDCGSTSLVYDDQRGEIICTCCGVVANSGILSSKPEWRAYNSDEENKRARIEISTTFKFLKDDHPGLGRIGFDFSGKRFNTSTKKKYHRLARINKRSYDKAIKRLKNVKIEFKRINSHLGLSQDIVESALSLYSLAMNKNMIKGRSSIEMAGAAMYLACRRKKAAVMIKDVAEATDISIKALGRSIRIFLSNINYSKMIQDPADLIHRLGEKLELTMITRRTAIEILIEARKKRILVGKSPMSSAAAAIYIATAMTGEKRTQQQIAILARTTPVTIRKRFKEIVEKLGIDNVKFKRGGGGKPVFINDPMKFNLQQISTMQ